MSKINENRPGYKHTPLGWIPEEWEVNLVDDLTKRGSGHTPDKAYTNYYGGGVKWISLADSSKLDKGLINETEIDISLEGLQNSSAVLHPKGTVVISRDAGVGKSAVMGDEMAVSQHFITWTCHDKLDKWFLYYWLQSKKEYFEKHAVGSTIKTLGLPFFKRLNIVTPILSEQHHIVAVISTWDKTIAATQRLISQKQLRDKAISSLLLTGKIRLRTFKKEWKESFLGDLFTERNETGYSHLQLHSVGSLGIYPQSQSEKRNTSNEDKSKYKRIRPGDIGYNTMRMWQGRSALSTIEGIISPAYTVVTPKEQVHPMFFALLFKLPCVIHRFFRNSQGLVEDTLNCKFKDFSIIKVKAPEYEEQVAIATVLTNMLQEIKLYKQKLSALQQQKKGLMQKLLTGEIRVKDLKPQV